MRLSIGFARCVAALTVGVALGCSGAADPLGGPYGGTGSNVPPGAGNVDSPDLADADTADADTAPVDEEASAPAGSSSGARRDSGAPSSSSSGGSGSSSGGPASGGSSSGSSGSGSSSGTTSPPTPTWSQIFSKYLGNATTGNCTRCHGQMGSASGSYSWLSSQRYISGTNSPLVKSGSCLTWYGGNMPPGGPRTNAQAVADMNAWAAAGAKNN
jgi:hypothetical protein